jgi:hypothetical protein
MQIAPLQPSAASPRSQNPFAMGGHPPPPPREGDSTRISHALGFVPMAIDRFTRAKDAFTAGGLAAAVDQLAHAEEAVNGIEINMEMLSPENAQPALQARAFDASTAALELRLDTIHGVGADQFLARCDAQIAEINAIAELLHAVHFPKG